MSPQKKVLLINPWIYDFTAYDFWLKPLGLLYIAALLKEYTDFELSYIDCLDRHHPLLSRKLKTKPDGRGPFIKEEVSKPQVLRKVPRKYSRYGIPLSLFSDELKQVHLPDLVLLTCSMTYWYPGVQTAVGMVRERFGHVPIVLGGVYPTLLAQHALSQTGVDAICQGPGERQIFSLINDILGDGVCPHLSIETLEELPFPAFGLLRDRTSLPLLTSRGCPLTCTFCASSLLFSGFEQRSVSSVLTELDVVCKLYKPRHIAFYDDALLLNNREHMTPILKGIIQKRLPLMFHTPNGLQVNQIDSELASLFKQAGFHSLYLSQETFDETVIKESCPKVSVEDLEKALDHLQTAGFRRAEINVYLMVGLPGQDISGIKDGILLVRSLGAQPRLAYFSPIPGTLEWERLVAEGYLDEKADPLLHNKLVFPYVWGRSSPDEFESLKECLKS
ncbi:MAG: radical SAM protein [Candidatus Aminicenantes bacterium]|nr:radical SAM protein [Candidatus Aminicenantes bacterium]MDH5385480.1 radical SAM protein [Candidatus Aminicenantes bacterium]MDH5742304.1 radical SAM protein [Candidatus Aminicenantes bacterium]